MFSSNQKFCVSCRKEQLKRTIELALWMHDDRPGGRCLAYQTTQDGRFVIGWYHKEPEPGWNKFMFERPGIDLIVEAVKQFANEHKSEWPDEEDDMWDGSHGDGYLIEAAPETMSREYNGVKNPFYAIISVRYFSCFYSK